MSGPELVVASPHGSQEVTTFLDGSERVVIRLGPAWCGYGTYRPGWRWSAHVQPLHGQRSAPHAGFVLSGQMVVRTPDGLEMRVEAGQGFFADAGHDAWVIGEVPCVALDFPVP